MLSSEDRSPARPTHLVRGIGVAVGVVLALLLAGCAFTPVYAPAPSGQTVSSDLAAVAIDTPNGRVEQVVRNDLIFAFAGGAPAAAPRYRLRLTVTVSENLVGVTRLSVAPSYSLDVAVAYELSEITGNTILTRGVARGVASYDRSNQGFANERAKRDAEDRGAASAADEIRLRVAAALVHH